MAAASGLPLGHEPTDDEVLGVLRAVQAREAPDPSVERLEVPSP